MSDWRVRLRAAGIHLGISLVIAVFAALLVFGVWYPYPYRDISGGRSLFLLVVAVDVIMGPLLTLAIFNCKKSRRELTMDLALVGALQMAALCYGLWTVAIARPVHLVFEYSRMTVVHAADVDPRMLSKAPVAMQALPLTGPTLLALRPFQSSEEQFDATMGALQGVPLSARSDLWQPYTQATDRILAEAHPAAELRERFPAQQGLIDKGVVGSGQPLERLRYLPLVGRHNAWTVLLDSSSAQPLAFIPLDPF